MSLISELRNLPLSINHNFIRFILLLAIVFTGHQVTAQDIVLMDTVNTHYRETLLSTYKTRITRQKEGFRDEFDKRRVRKEVADLYKGVAEGFIHQIEQGYFVDNSVYRQLLNGILKRLVNENPTYANRLKNTKILLSFGTMPNAYAIGNGFVVIYIPLIKKLQNKYELAFVISHEIAHNLLEHPFDAIVERAKLNTSKEFRRKTRRLSRKKFNQSAKARNLYRDLVYGFTEYSRAKEQQADSLGFVLFRNAYRQEAYQAVKSLLHLDGVDKARDSLTMDDFKTFFSTEGHPFRQALIANNALSKYNYDQSLKFWNVDSLKTHPDCRYRAHTLKVGFDVQPDSLYRVSSFFKKIKLSSWFNDVLGLYVLKDYGRSLYQGLVLLKTYPHNKFLQRIIYKNLRKIRFSRKSYQLNKYVQRLSPRRSDSYNTFLYIIRHLRRFEMNALIHKYKI